MVIRDQVRKSLLRRVRQNKCNHLCKQHKGHNKCNRLCKQHTDFATKFATEDLTFEK